MFSGPCDSKNLINDNKYQKIRKKIASFVKNVKLSDVKKLKTIPLPLETMQLSFIKT